MQKLQTLFLNNNSLHDWEDVRKICSLKSLRRLYLTGNKFSDASRIFNEETLQSGVFDSIIEIGMECNPISQWETISQFCSAFKNTETLRYSTEDSNYPITDPPGSEKFNLSSKSLIRRVLVALLPRLSVLNGGPISKLERQSSERYFLSLAGQGHPVISAVDEAGLQRERLTLLQGDILSISCTRNTQAATLGTSLVSVMLTSKAKATKGRTSIKKKLPQLMKLCDLKILSSRLFNVPVAFQRCMYNAGDMLTDSEMTEEGNDLLSYGVLDDSKITIFDTRDDQ